MLVSVLFALSFAPLSHASSDGFPVTIEHKYGQTTVAEKPRRIVSLSFIGHDFLLALQEPPHALRKWFGSHPYGIWPWAEEALGDAQPIVMQGEIDIERIALMEPDLIVGQWSGMSEREYRLLARIAPTISPQPGVGDYGTSWQDMLRVLGLATGKQQLAQQITSRIEARFTSIRAAHPDWQGASSVMVWAGRTGAYTERDIRGQFLKALGFKVPEAVNSRGTLNNFYVLIPAEETDAIDVDALIWLDAGGSISRLARLPLRPTMRVYSEGREIYSDMQLSSALSHSSPLSLDYALDRLVPMLEAAMDGDPATPVPGMAEVGLLPEQF